MVKEIADIQKETVHMQTQLRQLAEQTSELLPRIRESAVGKDVPTLHILLDQLHLRSRQYQALYRSMESAVTRLAGAEEEQEERAKDGEGTASAQMTLVMLQQMMTQIELEKKAMEALQEELQLEKQTARMDGAAQELKRLERLRTALKNSKD